MAPRFFSPNPIASSQCTLDGQEAHHLLHVMRLNVGDEVTVFDGRGSEYSARITVARRNQVELQVLDRVEADRELPFGLTLAVALPKGDRQRWICEKAVELGVMQLIPLHTEYSVAKPTPAALTRLRRAAIEASKQCGRNRLIEISEPSSWDTLISQQTEGHCIVAHPDGLRLGELLSARECNMAWTVAVGPEGGFADHEISEAVRRGWQIVDLGPRILRIETAALALCAAIALLAQPPSS